MTLILTPVASRTDQIQIQEKPEDTTPRSVDVSKSEETQTGRIHASTLLALATATQIFGSSHVGITDYFSTSHDKTNLSNDAPIGQREELFVSYAISTLGLGQENEAELVNRTRLELLARLYVSKKLSPEEDARLAIVTEKVRRLIPRVTVEDFETLQGIAEESEQIRKSIVARRQRLEI